MPTERRSELSAALPTIEGPLDIEAHMDGALWRVLLNAPKANIIDSGGAHAKSGLMSARISDGVMQESVISPSITPGARKELTELDLAFLTDVGYSIATMVKIAPKCVESPWFRLQHPLQRLDCPVVETLAAAVECVGKCTGIARQSQGDLGLSSGRPVD